MSSPVTQLFKGVRDSIAGDVGALAELEQLGTAYTQLRKDSDPDYFEYISFSRPALLMARAVLDRLEARFDATQAEIRLLHEEIRIREESQIPMIPRAAAERLEAADREIASLKRALWMSLRIAERGVGADTTPEQVLQTLVGFIARKLAERQPPDVPLRRPNVLGPFYREGD